MRPPSEDERSMKTFAPGLPSPVQLFGCVLVTWFSISEYRHVSPSVPFLWSPLPSNGCHGRHFFRGPVVPHLRRYYGLIRFLTVLHQKSPVALDFQLPLRSCYLREL